MAGESNVRGEEARGALARFCGRVFRPASSRAPAGAPETAAIAKPTHLSPDPEPLASPPMPPPEPLMPGEPIANFEGQLKISPKDLNLDETEYARILKHLGLGEDELRRRRRSWWQCLRPRRWRA